MKFIVWFQVSVKISMILPRKQMPTGHPHQEAPSLRRLSELEQNLSKVSCEPELLQGEFRAAASEILSIMASANAVNKAAFVQKRRYQGLPSLHRDAPCPPQ